MQGMVQCCMMILAMCSTYMLQGLEADLSDPATLMAELLVATNYSRAAYG